jgi:hypothetical protein
VITGDRTFKNICNISCKCEELVAKLQITLNLPEEPKKIQKKEKIATGRGVND